MLWNRFCPGFPLRFGFCFRQLVDSFFCQMAGFLHGMAWYKVVLYGFDILMALVLVFMAIRVYSKVPMTEEQFQNRKRMSKKGKRIMWIVIAVAVIAIAVVFYLWAWPLLVKAFKI